MNEGTISHEMGSLNDLDAVSQCSFNEIELPNEASLSTENVFNFSLTDVILKYI